MTTDKESQMLLTRDLVKKLHEELLEAIKPVIEAHGLALGARPTRMSFTSKDLKFSVEAAVKNVDGDVETKEADAYRRLANILYAMDTSWLFKRLKTPAGPVYKIIGLNTRSRRMPVLAERDGKIYKVSPQAFKGAKLIS